MPGLSHKRKAVVRMRSESHRRVLRLYEKGVPVSAIVAMTGYSRRRVSRIVREYLALEWLAMHRAFGDVRAMEAMLALEVSG